MSKIKYETGYVACVECTNGMFPNGSKYLYSEPHQSYKQAEDWASAISNSKLIRIESNQVPSNRIVR